MSKRKKATLAILVVYVLVLICATLFVPVKASILERDRTGGPVDVEAQVEYGYYPIWAVSAFNRGQTQGTPATATSEDMRVLLVINVTSWVIQYLCITLVFASLWWQVRRYYP